MKLFIKYKLQSKEDLEYLNVKAHDINEYIALAPSPPSSPLIQEQQEQHQQWKESKWQQCAELISIAMIFIRDPNVTIVDIGSTSCGLTVKQHETQSLLSTGQHLLQEDEEKFHAVAGTASSLSRISSSAATTANNKKKKEVVGKKGNNSSSQVSLPELKNTNNNTNTKLLKKYPIATASMRSSNSNKALLATATRSNVEESDTVSTTSSQGLMQQLYSTSDSQLYPVKKKTFVKYL